MWVSPSFFIIRASLGEPAESCDYVVVLGAKVRDSGPSASLWDRIYGARDYLEAHPDVIAIVSGGQGPDEPMSEAQAIYDELVKLGIDENRIWLEDKATSTWENLNFTLELIEEKQVPGRRRSASFPASTTCSGPAFCRYLRH